jgi:uncharacterized protein YjiS (DUF1127 family)
MPVFSKRMKRGSALQTMLRYAAEVLIIFLGITISFLFDQWREDRQQKRDLTELSESLLMDIGSLQAKLKEDLAGSENWIAQLDSLRIQRTSKTFSDRQLAWFSKVITGQIFFLFQPHSPTYLSAANSSLYSELPDTIKNELYTLYQVRLPLFQLLYNLQQENITAFRNSTVVPAPVYLYQPDGSGPRPDLQMLAQEISRPVYGNFINQVILMEKEVYQLNEDASASLTKLESSLRHYIRELKD